MTSKKPKVLYGINCTGQGHISRARTIIPHLEKHADIDILISGAKQKVDLPFDYTFKFKGVSFVYHKGKVDWKKTFSKNNFVNLFKDILLFPVSKYDFVITDFEPISAYACFLKQKHCIHMSHQISFLSKCVPHSKHRSLKEKISHAIMSFHPSDAKIGFHYKNYDKYVFPPLRKITSCKSSEKKSHYCVYFPAFSKTDVLKDLQQLEDVEFHFFHHNNRQITREHNVQCYPLSQIDFQNSLSSSQGYLTHAGFESTAEALCLGIPLLSIPIQDHYEQECNTVALKKLGASVLETFELEKVNMWIKSAKKPVQIESCDLEILIQHILQLGTKQ